MRRSASVGDIRAPTSVLSETPVEANFRVWTRETEVHPGHRDQERKEWDGEEYYAWFQEMTVDVPLRLARIWKEGDIDELIRDLLQLPKKFVGARKLANYLGHTRSKDTVLELLSKRPVYEFTGSVPDVLQVRAHDGVRKVINRWCSHPVYEEFRGSLEKQYVELDYEIQKACGPNVILNTLAAKWNSKYKKRLLTPEKIEQLTGRELASGYLWADMCKVFEWCGVIGRLYTRTGRLLDEFEPSKVNTNLGGRGMVVVAIYEDGHYFGCYEEGAKKSLAQIETRSEAVIVSDKFRRVAKDPVSAVCRDLDESAKLAMESGQPFVSFLWRGDDLAQVLHRLLAMDVVPNVGITDLNTIESLTYPLGQASVNIRYFDEPRDAKLTDDEVMQMWTKEHELKQTVLDCTERAGLLSRYDPDVLDRLSMPELRGHPPSGLFRENDLGALVVGIDQKLCFTHKLYSAEFFPVFSVFDRFRALEPGEAIQPYSLYHTGRETRYGFALGDEQPSQVCHPHRLKRNPFRKAIRGVLEDTSMKVEVRKLILNKAIGFLGKVRNSATRARVFKIEEEAERQRLEWDGTIRPWNGMWLVAKQEEQTLSEGFLAVHKMVYDMVHIAMRDLRKELEAKSIRPIGVKVDCLFVSPSDALKLGLPHKSEVETNVSTLGAWKLEDASKLKLTKPVRVPDRMKMPVEPRAKTTVHTVANEWDLGEIRELLVSGGNWVITSKYPGSGKTKAAVEFGKASGKSFVVVTFSNRHTRKFRSQGCEAVTLHRLCGVRVGKEEKNFRSLGPYDIVIVDELGMHGSRSRSHLLAYMSKHPETQFIATEDLRQIKPIEEDWNGHADWYREATARMFPNELNLLEMKRFTASGKKRILELEQILFEGGALEEPLVSDWASSWTPDTLCVSYTNDTLNKVNNTIHFEILGHKELWVRGQTYIARKRFRKLIFPQEDFVLESWNEEIITLLDDGERIEVPRFSNKKVDRLSPEFFALPYVLTGHAVQGESRDGPVMIFDSKCPCVDVNWLWVALTRARDPSKVTVVAHEPESMKREQIQKKLDSHKTQDLRAGRDLGPKSEWVEVADIRTMSKKQGHRCFLCGGIMNFVNTGSGDDWSPDRIDNTLPLLRGNFKLSHVYCNTAKFDCHS